MGSLLTLQKKDQGTHLLYSYKVFEDWIIIIGGFIYTYIYTHIHTHTHREALF